MDIFENHDGRDCLTIIVEDIDDRTAELFDELELHGGGPTWRGVIDGLVALRLPGEADRLTDIWTEADNANLYCADRELLERVAALFREAVADHRLVRAAIDRCDGEIE